MKSTRETDREKAEQRLQELISIYEAELKSGNHEKEEEASAKVEDEIQEKPKQKRRSGTRQAVPHLVQLNGIWYIRIRVDGKYRFKSTKQKEREAAEKVFQEYVDAGELPPVTPKISSAKEENQMDEFQRNIITYLKLINKQLEGINRRLDHIETRLEERSRSNKHEDHHGYEIYSD